MMMINRIFITRTYISQPKPTHDDDELEVDVKR